MNTNYENLIYASLKSIKNQIKMLNNNNNINELEVYYLAQRMNILEKMFVKYIQNLKK